MKQKVPLINLVIFDLDGTLVNAFGDIAAAANYALEQQGYVGQSLEQITSFVGGGGRLLMQRCLSAARASELPLDGCVVDQGFSDWQHYYANHPGDLAFAYPGAVTLLEELKKREIKCAVLSNKLNGLVVDTIKHLKMAHLFDVIQGQVIGTPIKPDPVQLQTIIGQCGATAQTTLMVGDGEADMLVARNAGVRAVAVSYGVCSEETLLGLGATASIDELSELLNVIDQS